MPKKELAIFDGDPLEYWNFIKLFKTSIVSISAASESEKLMYLLQYTSGVAKDTIKCCLYKDPSLGYQAARRLLEERFGHPFRIASQYVTKLTEGPPLKPSDRTGLLAFADQLKDCENTLESIGYLDEINSADNLRRIVQRLPFHLRTKFVEVADQIQEAGQRTNISHIAEFVKIKARAANNPVFGCVIDDARGRSDSQRRKPNPKRATLPDERGNAFSTQEIDFREGRLSSPGHKEAPSTRYAVCPVCNAAHPLAKCKVFIEKNFEERLQVMRKAQLCHNCFKYGHIAVGCLARSTCEVQGCKRRHHTLLHPPPSQQSVENRTRVSVEQGTQVSSGTPLSSGQTNSTSTGGGKVCLRVVPVKVRSRDADKVVETYALLDSGSDISLCDKTLARELGVRGQEKTFFLTTQEREDSPRVGHEISLTVDPPDARLAHLKPMTVPRLELSATVLAVQLDKSVREELDVPITQSTYWSDSTCVLQYIRNQSKRFHTFVANRLSVIHENSAPHQWRHISSELNPADEVSRGLTVEEMCANSKWLNGPQFLTRKDEFWPRDPTLHEPELSDDDPEIKRAQSNSQSSSGHQSGDVLSSLIERHSSWERLKRAVAWLHRFRTWFIERYSRSPISSKVKSSVNRRVLSVDEMKEAEREIIKHTQRISFPEVIQALQRIGSLQHSRQATSELKNLKMAGHIRKLHPLLDEMGILRVGGRLENALIDYDAKHPIILPYRDHVTDLIISQHHQKTGHLGQE